MPRPPLDVVQQWFQAVITHPGGVAAGAAAPAARDLVRLDRGDLEALVRRSRRLSAEERLSIYANAYYARLLECLGDCFPVLRQLLGAAVFDGFAFDYLQAHPSRSYTLTRLATSFPRFLAATRPGREPAATAAAEAGAAGHGEMGPHAAPPAPDAPADWADLLIDLATLELAIAEVFDGPGAEGEPLLDPGSLPPAAEFAAARLHPVPCLRLLRFRFPVNALYSQARALLAAPRDGEPAPAGVALLAELDVPDPAVEHVALSRSDFVVRRHALSALEHGVLAALLAGATVGEAIAAAADAAPGDLSDEALAGQLHAAFRRWTAAGFFRAATVTS